MVMKSVWVIILQVESVDLETHTTFSQRVLFKHFKMVENNEQTLKKHSVRRRELGFQTQHYLVVLRDIWKERFDCILR